MVLPFSLKKYLQKDKNVFQNIASLYFYCCPNYTVLLKKQNFFAANPVICYKKFFPTNKDTCCQIKQINFIAIEMLMVT
jgi:hypothetical protein